MENQLSLRKEFPVVKTLYASAGDTRERRQINGRRLAAKKANDGIRKMTLNTRNSIT